MKLEFVEDSQRGLAVISDFPKKIIIGWITKDDHGLWLYEPKSTAIYGTELKVIWEKIEELEKE